MLTFTSKSYLYSRPSLIEQYCRYSEAARDSNDGKVIPCYVVDTADQDIAYMEKVNIEMIVRTQTKNPKGRYSLRENSESSECLKNGLNGFYRTTGYNPMTQRIVNREYEALQKYELVDEIRRQMRFVLKASGNLEDVVSISGKEAFDKVTKCFEKYGISPDQTIKENSINHFENWGTEFYEYVDAGKTLASMKYVPKKRSFELIRDINGAVKKTLISCDIVELTKKAIDSNEELTNPEERWINTEDQNSLRKKHGYFSDYELTFEQDMIHKKAIEKIDKYLGKVNLPDNELGQLIVIQGEAGTGKTVLAQKIFIDILKQHPNLNCYFVVNHNELISQYKSELKKYDIKEEKVDKPSVVLNAIDKLRGEEKNRPDIIFVDEAHLMNTRKTQQYTDKNKNFIKADNMILDMRRSARIVVIMFDENQILRGEQCWGNGMLESLIDESIEKGNYAILKRQMRIEAEQEVVDWISTFVKKHKINTIPKEIDYTMRIYDSVRKMYNAIKGYASVDETKNSRMVATFDWKWSPSGDGKNKKDPWFVSVEEEKWKLPWNNEHSTRNEYYANKYKQETDKPWIEQEYSLDEVGSTFSVQGFDMPYVGVILGKSLSYDKDTKTVKIVPERCMDHGVTDAVTTTDGEKVIKTTAFRERLIWNAVNILLTRGRKGLFIYAVDKDLREALLNAYGEMNTVDVPEEYEEILLNKNKWSAYTRRSYEVMIQKASEKMIYNVPDKPGYVFNKLELSNIDVTGYSYIVTGLAGEMWPIQESSLVGYEANPDDIKAKPKAFKTRTNDITYYAVQIPVEKEFKVSLANGTVLNGNSYGVEHGTGDYLLCTDFENKDYRIINGYIFDQIYQIK